MRAVHTIAYGDENAVVSQVGDKFVIKIKIGVHTGWAILGNENLGENFLAGKITGNAAESRITAKIQRIKA
jgi:hypothetical protein